MSLPTGTGTGQTSTDQSCGAFVTGVDLSLPLSGEQISEICKAWLEHHAPAIPKQELNDDQFERFAACFGEFGEDPFFNPIEGRKYIATIRREANETNPIFAEGWHSDWSFLLAPPSATMLYSLDIPPEDGELNATFNPPIQYRTVIRYRRGPSGPRPAAKRVAPFTISPESGVSQPMRASLSSASSNSKIPRSPKKSYFEPHCDTLR